MINILNEVLFIFHLFEDFFWIVWYDLEWCLFTRASTFIIYCPFYLEGNELVFFDTNKKKMEYYVDLSPYQLTPR